MTDTLIALARGVLPIALAALAASTFAAPAGPVSVYVGTYTDGTSRGIYRFTFDTATGAVTAPVLAVETKNPSFLALHPGGRFLYAAGEVDTFAGAKTGFVSAFSVDERTGALVLVDQQASRGTDPCHLVVDRSGRAVLVANYSGGNVALLPLAADGRLKPASVVRQDVGTGPDRSRQEGPHAHGIALDAAERYALVADLGADRIFVYRFDAARGTLDPNDPPAAALAPGSGPRHLAFHPSGRYVYAIDELRSTVTLFRYDPVRGVLETTQTVSTLPAGFSGENSTAEVAVSPDGRFLYGSNRGHDSLAVFAIDAGTGTLTPKGHVPTGGRAPRHFALDPSGRWLLAANQDSGRITVFRLDPTTGVPSPAGKEVAVPKPVCVLFAPPPR